MTEQEFSDLIDCRFPYHDEPRWKALVDLGRTISANAAFMALEEICRVPRGEFVLPAAQREMVRHWRAGFAHPLADVVASCALAAIDNRRLPAERVLHVMDMIARDRGQYAALSIAYFGCEDEGDRVERRREEIVAAWQARPEDA